MSESNNDTNGEELATDSVDGEDIEIKEQTSLGRKLIYLIVTSPFIVMFLLLAMGSTLILSGSVSLNFTITGELPVTTVWNTVVAPYLIGLGLMFSLVWLLGVIWWFGSGAVVGIGRVIEKAIRDYGGLE